MRLWLSDWSARLGRRDLAVAALIAIVALGLRGSGLDRPANLIFDENAYVRTGLELIQNERYSPHPLLEQSHPFVAKYGMALSVAAFGGPAIERAADFPGAVGALAVVPDGKTDLILAAGGPAGIYFRALGQPDRAWSLAYPVSALVAADSTNSHLFVVSSDLHLVDFDLAGLLPMPPGPIDPDRLPGRDLGQLSQAVNQLFLVGQTLYVRIGSGLLAIDAASGQVTAQTEIDASGLVAPGGDRLAVAVGRTVALLDAQLRPVATIEVPSATTALTWVDGSDLAFATTGGLAEPHLFAATASGTLEDWALGPDGLVFSSSLPLPAPATWLGWDRASGVLDLFGGGRLYLVEPRGLVLFADSALPFAPVAAAFDSNAARPDNSRGRLALATADGGLAWAAVDRMPFAARLPGLLLASLTIGLLYLLGVALFRRRSIGLIAAFLVLVDGRMFVDARMALIEPYTEFFTIAALLLCVVLLARDWSGSGRRGMLMLGSGLAVAGALFGLAIASKWVALCVLGAVLIYLLWRSLLGRAVVAVAAVIVGAFLGAGALGTSPPDLVGVVLVVVGTFTIGGLALRDRPANSLDWTSPRFARGLPFVWALVCLTVVPLLTYVATYIPWALLASDGQTFLGLQAAMLGYHETFRIVHSAASPWWSWPFDLRPIAAYVALVPSVGQQVGTPATWDQAAQTIGIGNPVVSALTLPAMALASWKAWRWRTPGVAFVLLVLVAAWLPWAFVGQVVFDYHWWDVLPYVALLIAWLIVELWGRRNATAVRVVRVVVPVALFVPVLAWLLVGPLCGLVGADPTAFVCSQPVSTYAPTLLIYGLGAGALAALFAWRAGDGRIGAGTLLAVAGIFFGATYPVLAAVPVPVLLAGAYHAFLPTFEPSFSFAANLAPPPPDPGLLVLALALTGLAVALIGGAWLGRRHPARVMSELDADSAPKGKKMIGSRRSIRAAESKGRSVTPSARTVAR